MFKNVRHFSKLKNINIAENTQNKQKFGLKDLAEYICVVEMNHKCASCICDN